MTCRSEPEQLSLFAPEALPPTPMAWGLRTDAATWEAGRLRTLAAGRGMEEFYL